MKIQLVVLSAIATCCAAIKPLDLNAGIPVDSKLGGKLLSKARRVEDQEEEDFTWLLKYGGYSIRFESCHTIELFGGEGERDQDEDGSSPVQNQNLVSFKLCPGNSECDKCQNGGQYVVKMREFLEAYLQITQEMKETQCEAVAENCSCDYYEGDDEACETKCYYDAGLDFCEDEDEDEGEFDVNEYIECVEAEFSDDAYYSSTYFIGPVCASSGNAIYLDLFKDRTCSKSTDNSIYSTFANGDLPYATESLVDSECVSCKVTEDYYNGKQYYNEPPNEICTELYQESAKCERNVVKDYPDVGSCTYINNVLPALERVHWKKSGTRGATILAWAFFSTTLAASVGLFHFYNIATRKDVVLSGGATSGGAIL